MVWRVHPCSTSAHMSPLGRLVVPLNADPVCEELCGLDILIHSGMNEIDGQFLPLFIWMSLHPPSLILSSRFPFLLFKLAPLHTPSLCYSKTFCDNLFFLFKDHLPFPLSYICAPFLSNDKIQNVAPVSALTVISHPRTSVFSAAAASEAGMHFIHYR